MRNLEIFGGSEKAIRPCLHRGVEVSTNGAIFVLVLAFTTDLSASVPLWRRASCARIARGLEYTLRMDPNVRGLDQLTEALGAARILVVTGAGISLASGVPTFRGSDPGAIWAKSVKEKGTRAYFERDPVGSWSWYLERFGLLEGKEPNPAHHALVRIEEIVQRSGREFLLVTQNVDSLHEKAGSTALVKVHGSADRARCSRDGCTNGAPRGSLAISSVDTARFIADPVLATVPRCNACEGLVRPHVLWFDEIYTEHADYQFDRVTSAANRADVALFVGTSFAVGITDLVVEACRGRSAVWSIDPVGRPPNTDVSVLAARAEEALPVLAERLHPSAR